MTKVMNRKYTQEHIDFLKENIEGCKIKDLTRMFNSKFGLSISEQAMNSIVYKRGLKNGIDCKIKNGRTCDGERSEFKKGHVPINKGTKGMFNVGGNKTSFKAGQKPYNYMPVGSERVNGDGYIDIKIADPKTWRAKHILIWEKMHGPVPKGCVVIFADRNNRNFDIDNLLLVTKRELLVLNRKKLIKNDADLTRTGVLIADINIKVAEIKKKK